MTLTGVFVINQNVIEVYDDKNIEFFHLDFVDVSLKAGGVVGKTEKYDLVFKIAVPHLEGCFSLVTLPNSYSMIYVY